LNVKEKERPNGSGRQGTDGLGKSLRGGARYIRRVSPIRGDHGSRRDLELFSVEGDYVWLRLSKGTEKRQIEKGWGAVKIAPGSGGCGPDSSERTLSQSTNEKGESDRKESPPPSSP